MLYVGRLQSHPSNIRLSWKHFTGTNALTYYENSSVTAVKRLVILATVVSVLTDMFFQFFKVKNPKIVHNPTTTEAVEKINTFLEFLEC